MCAACIFAAAAAAPAEAAEGARSRQSTRKDDYAIDREEVFDFAREPVVTRDGDRVTVSFETEGYCDVTVAVEDAEGRIVRHLASGVLGDNAPKPFARGSRRQTVVWDGKDEQGRYVDDKDSHTVRVSLGLEARFERTLLWSPHRRVSTQGGTFNSNGAVPAFCAQPEGVYVFDGRMYDHVRLFDHEGTYVRTVYPFPADKLGQVAGLKTHTFPGSRRELPVRGGTYETTFLTSGTNYGGGHGTGELHGLAATGMAVRKGRVALVCRKLNRLSTDGSTGGLPLEGPTTQIDGRLPRSAAFSPDGATLYLTGFVMDTSFPNTKLHWAQGVARIDYAKGAKMEVFAGSLSPDAKHGGSAPGRFKTPCSVDCGPKGRVYVADHFNNRIQVFDPSGKHLKSIPVERPSEVCVDQRSGEIYAFSWYLDDRAFRRGKKPPRPVMTHFGPLDDPKAKGTYPLPIPGTHMKFGRYGGDAIQGRQFRAAIDSWAPGGVPTVWMIRWVYGKGGSAAQGAPLVLRPDRKKKKLLVVCDFAKKAKARLPRLEWSGHGRDRLYPRPTTAEVFVLSDGFERKPTVLDPGTGRARLIDAPFSADEMAFDIDGHAYLRTHREIVRYEIDSGYRWREVPFDYGEGRARIGTFMGKKSGEIRSAVIIDTPNIHHEGGIYVAPGGKIVAAYIIGKVASKGKAWVHSDFAKRARAAQKMFKGWKWTPPMFPGRGGTTIVRVWDRYGLAAYGDAVRGVGYIDGVFIDRDDNLYVTSAGTRAGFSRLTGTLAKFRPEGKILTTEAKIPLASQRPKRAPDTTGGAIGAAWWEGAEWLYGGIGITGKDAGASHACNCPNYRPAFDYFARTFVPETRRYTIAVLDTAGNLITRIGRYGNVDDGVPLVTDGALEGHTPKPLGGDEVGLFYPAYLGTHTDRRLYVTDQGNGRILSVKLGYHAEHRTALEDVKDSALP
jgi:DNA-binding beta-propeller fold protein YncE